MPKVAIMGSGLSGTIVGSMLARAGIDTVLLDRLNNDRMRLPETIKITPKGLADLLGLNIHEISDCFSNKLSTCFISDKTQESIYIEHCTNAQIGPFRIARSKLDQILLNNAIRLGCKYISNSHILSVDFLEKKQIINYKIDNQARNIEADIVIDATGKQALLANQLNLQQSKQQLDNRTAIFSHFEHDRFFPTIKWQCTTIVPFKIGFIFIIPLVEPRFAVGVVLPDQGVETDLEKTFSKAVQSVMWLHEVLKESKQVLPYLPTINHSFTVSKPSGEGYFIIGEALGFRDPFYCDGIQFSLDSALLCYQSLMNYFMQCSNGSKIHRQYKRTIQKLLDESRTAWDKWLDENGFLLDCKSLTDPHIPYSINYFLSGLTKDKNSFASKSLNIHRRKFSLDKGSHICN